MEQIPDSDDDYEDELEEKKPKLTIRIKSRRKRPKNKTLPSQDKKSTDEKTTSEDEMDKRTERRLEKKIKKLQKKMKKDMAGSASGSASKPRPSSKGELEKLLSDDKKFHLEQFKIRDGRERVRKKFLVKEKPSASGWDKKSGEQDIGLPKYFENYTKYTNKAANTDFIKNSVAQDSKDLNMLEYLFEKEPEMKPADKTDLSIEDLYHREVRTHMINLLNECKRIEAERQSMRTTHTLSSLSLSIKSIRALARSIFNGTPKVHQIASPSFELLNWLLERHQKEITFPRNFIIIILSRLAEMFWQFGQNAQLKQEFIYSGLIDSVYEIMKGFTKRKLEACWACYSMCMASVGCGNLIEEIRKLEGVELALEILSQDVYWGLWEHNFAQFLQSILWGPNYPALKGVKLFKFTIRDRETSDKIHLIGDKNSEEKSRHHSRKSRKRKNLVRKNKVQDQPKTKSELNQDDNFDDTEIEGSIHDIKSSETDGEYPSVVKSADSEASADSESEYLQYLETSSAAEKDSEDHTDSN